MSKGPDAFRTISEVAEELDLPQHVLRFWETRFTQIKPMKRGGGRRYYRPDDIDLLRGIRRLLYGEGYTIKGVQRILKEQGPRHVIAAGQGMGLDPAPEGGEPDDYGVDNAQDLDFEPASDLDDFDDAPEPADHGRREPMFGARADSAPERHHTAPSIRVAGERPLPQEPSFHGRSHAAEPAPPQHSRIPAAPPDLPSSADDYLPPLVADLPSPPERGAGSARAESPYAPPQASSRREPQLSQHRAHGGDDDYAEPPTERHSTPQAAPARAAERYAVAQQPASAGLGHGDRERLQATLMELLECKRILDNVR
jgi:DNA-binding transcriptional MerR regulator